MSDLHVDRAKNVRLAQHAMATRSLTALTQRLIASARKMKPWHRAVHALPMCGWLPARALWARPEQRLSNREKRETVRKAPVPIGRSVSVKALVALHGHPVIVQRRIVHARIVKDQVDLARLVAIPATSRAAILRVLRVKAAIMRNVRSAHSGQIGPRLPAMLRVRHGLANASVQN